MGSLPPLALAGAIVACVGELFHIVGLATPNWIIAKVVDANTGLFESCIGGNCVDNENPKSELEAVQAMCILGMIAGLVAVGVAIVFLVFTIMSKSTPSIMGLVTLAAGIAAFVFIIIGVIVYAAEIYDKVKDSSDLGFSFGLTITGGIFLLIGSILFFMGAKSSD